MIKKKILPYLVILFSLIFIGLGIKYELFNFSSEDSPLSKSLSLKGSQNNVCNKDRITIENGCGINNLGRIYKKYLLSEQYDVDRFIDASNFGHTATKIYFHKNNKDCARELANKLGVKSNQIHEDNNLNYYHDLTLVLGKDYKNLKSYDGVKKHNPFQ